MTQTAEDPDARPISIIDAVCCVYFCAAGNSRLLIAILTTLGMEILIPAEVETEVLGKKSCGQLVEHWPKLKASGRVRVLERLTVEDDRSDIVGHVARIRGMSARLALSHRKDLGEAVVLGHAKYLTEQGHKVYVLIDDQGGQALAALEQIEVMTVEDLLLTAVKLDLLPSARLKKTYDNFRQFGSGLPTWNASQMKVDYTAWKQNKT